MEYHSYNKNLQAPNIWKTYINFEIYLLKELLVQNVFSDFIYIFFLELSLEDSAPAWCLAFTTWDDNSQLNDNISARENRVISFGS